MANAATSAGPDIGEGARTFLTSGAASLASATTAVLFLAHGSRLSDSWFTRLRRLWAEEALPGRRLGGTPGQGPHRLATARCSRHAHEPTAREGKEHQTRVGQQRTPNFRVCTRGRSQRASTACQNAS